MRTTTATNSTHAVATAAAEVPAPRKRTAPGKAPRVECLCPDCNGLVTLVRRAGRIEVMPHTVHRRIAGRFVAVSCGITALTETQAATVLAVTRATLVENFAELTAEVATMGARRALAEFDTKSAEFLPTA